MIREMKREDIPVCAELLRSIYNNELWQCRWNHDTAVEYLTDFFEMKKFIDFVLEDTGEILGALFAHEKVWWNNSEVFVEEMFVKPSLQRKGYGTILLEKLSDYVREKGFAGITLSTNKYAPAPKFYKKNGFEESGHVLFMCS